MGTRDILDLPKLFVGYHHKVKTKKGLANALHKV